MSPRRGDRVTVPPPQDQWDVRFGTSDAADGWEELCRHALSNTRRCLETLRADPRSGAGHDRQHRLRGDLATHRHNGREARTFSRNLSALMDILDGKGRPSNAATLAAWQTFFLVIPVVSTTFASFDKLFDGLGCEALGWLFVDEAGQAPPQHAVGALWRARRAVIVGDPLQLKPVVTLPWGGQRALLREFGVGEQWAPSRTSVQQVADRLAEHGTALPGPASDEPVWVGTPLRVHRRCARLMFGISNRIAYDGLMVFGTPDRPAFHGQDEWRHIGSATSDRHWIPAEGEELRSVLSQLRDAGVAATQIRVIPRRVSII